MGVAAMSAQTVEEAKAQAKERIAFRKQTRKVAEQKCMKDARAQAKRLAKEGWKPVAGTESLVNQLNGMLLMQYESNGKLPKYFIGHGEGSSTMLAMAQKMAETRARTQIAEQMGGEIAELITEDNSSTGLSTGEMEEVMKVTSNSKQIFQQKIGRNQVVFQAERTVDGKKEVSVAVAYDGARAKEDILAELAKSSAEASKKLDEYLKK